MGSCKYARFTVLDGVSPGQAGKLSGGLTSFAESGRFAWNTSFYGSNAKFTPISKELGLAGGLDMAEVVLVSQRVKLTNIAATTIRQGANLADDAARGGTRCGNEAIGLATSSKSLAPSRTYTIFDGSGQGNRIGKRQYCNKGS